MEIAEINAIKNRGAKHRARQAFVLSHPEKTNKELAIELGVTEKTVAVLRQGTVYQLGNNALATSKRWDKKISDLLSEKGIANTLANHRSPHSIELENKKKIEVVFCGKPYKTRGYNSFFYNLNKRKHGDDYADYFILIAGNLDTTYIVPSAEAPNQMTLPAKEDKKRKQRSKYEKFLNAFYLLRQEHAVITV